MRSRYVPPSQQQNLNSLVARSRHCKNCGKYLRLDVWEAHQRLWDEGYDCWDAVATPQRPSPYLPMGSRQHRQPQRPSGGVMEVQCDGCGEYVRRAVLAIHKDNRARGLTCLGDQQTKMATCGVCLNELPYDDLRAHLQAEHSITTSAHEQVFVFWHVFPNFFFLLFSFDF